MNMNPGVTAEYPAISTPISDGTGYVDTQWEKVSIFLSGYADHP